MQRISDTQKCMASLAVFRNLFENKKDIYSVISEFANQIIIKNNIRSTCHLSDITKRLIEDYGFEVPDSVVKNAIKRLPYAQVAKGSVAIDNSRLPQLDTSLANYDKVKKQNDVIYEKLIKYVETETERTLSNEERKILLSEFCGYIVNETTSGTYVKYIYCFILSNKTDSEFMNQISEIREGVIAFVGLTYQTNDNSIDILDEHLSIYLDTEILFHMAGYNGDLCKRMFDEFYELVEKVNTHSKGGSNKKRIIDLKYFPETINEVENYFESAIGILKNNKVIRSNQQAMDNIVTGCSYAYQVKEKQSEFYQMLKQKGISRCDHDEIYDNSDYKLVIEHAKYVDNAEGDTNKVLDSIKLLQIIRNQRGNRIQKYFRSIRHILLTGKTLTSAIAYDISVTDEKNVPLATTLSFLTNRFWFSLNKGLGKNTLVSFDIIAKTRMALSSLINEKVGTMYDQIESEVKSGIMTAESAKSKLAMLRKECVNADDINSENFSDDGYLSFLSMNDVNAVAAERDKIITDLKDDVKQRDENIRLTKEQLTHTTGEINQMVAVKLAELNHKAQKEYEDEMNRYTVQKHAYLALEDKKCIAKQTCIIILFALFVIALFWFNKILLSIPSLVLLSEILVWFIPSIRACVDHTKYRNAYLYIYDPKERDNFLKILEEEYITNHPEPTLRVYAEEEVKEILLGRE